MVASKAQMPVSITAAVAVLSLCSATAVYAQQHRQTDLDFTRQRAQLQAAEGRIASLRKRLHRDAAESNLPGTKEHVLLGRDSAPPPGDSAPAVAAAAIPTSQPEHRTPQSLRHRERAVSAGEVQSLDARLDAAARHARSLGERINRPDFGAGLRDLDEELDDIEAGIDAIEDTRRRASQD